MTTKNKNNYLKGKLLKIIFIFFLLILPVTLFVFFAHQNKKKLSVNSNKKNQNKEKIINVKTPNTTPTYAKENFFQSKKMFFTFKVEHIDLKNKIIYIFLDADNDFATSDAIDLELESDNNIEIKKITPGDSFNFYPRKIINKNNILVTGAALSENGQIKMAKPKSNFIKLYLEIKNPKVKSSIKINQIKTKIFFHGEDITDIQNSFKKINLNYLNQ